VSSTKIFLQPDFPQAEAPVLGVGWGGPPSSSLWTGRFVGEEQPQGHLMCKMRGNIILKLLWAWTKLGSIFNEVTH
jgi:hypothetical protein